MVFSASMQAAAKELGVPTLREVPAAGLQRRFESLSSDLLRRRARHVVTEIGRVEQAVEALRQGDFARLGALFLESHASMRDDFEISVAELDTAVEESVAAGALGARMTGGGFGGSAIALIPAERADHARRRIAQAFSDKGFRAPQSFVVAASGAAQRDR
jgi:galactokinase